MKRLLLLGLWLVVVGAVAQPMVQGTVLDSTTREPLPTASVTLLAGHRATAFTKTDDNGRFSLRGEGDHVQVTFLGYRKQILPISSAESVTILLSPAAFALKEVQVKGSRVLGRADTISYDLSRFSDERDNTLKDVLRKLPGVDVEQDGIVKYNGKPIDRFTVEGLDLTGGSYDKVNEALRAKDVERADIIEHDQPIKALQDKLMSDAVAMNIRLKPEARDHWFPTVEPVVGLSERGVAVQGRGRVLQMGRRRQQLYMGCYDRSGRNLHAASQLMTMGSTTAVSSEVSVPQWFSLPQLKAPIDAERLRFNTSCDLSLNRVAKPSDDDREQRTVLHYLHTVERQHTENSSAYHFAGRRMECVDEMEDFRLSRYRLELEWNSRLNRSDAYGNEALHVAAYFAEGTSDYGQTTQQVRMAELHVQNNWHRIVVADHHQWALRSDVEYSFAPQRLTVGGEQSGRNPHLWHADHSVQWLGTRHHATLSCTAGLLGEGLVQGGAHQSLLSAYVLPNCQWMRGSTRADVSLPLRWVYHTRQHDGRLLPQPRLLLSHRQGNRREWTAVVAYRATTGDWVDFAWTRYRRDYRTWVQTCGEVPLQQRLTGSLHYTYKRPVQEFFINVSSGWHRAWHSQTTDLTLSNGQYLLQTLPLRSQDEGWSVQGTVSKGIFALRLKTVLGLAYTDSRGSQLSVGQWTDYRLRRVAVTPELSFTPHWCVVTYRGEFGFSRATERQTLADWRQQLALTATVGRVDCSLGATHYHQEVDELTTKNTVVADLRLVWRTKKVRWSMEWRNLLNQQSYVLTTYSGVLTSTDREQLRPRECLLTAQWSL